MKSVSVSDAKQNFGDLIASAQRSPVAIKRRGKVVAILSHPAQFLSEDPFAVRRLAKQTQKSLEQERLMQHQRIAIRMLLAKSDEASELIERVRAEVEHWASDSLCSIDFITLWREIVELPLPELAAAVCGEYREWGWVCGIAAKLAMAGGTGKTLRDLFPLLAEARRLSRHDDFVVVGS